MTDLPANSTRKRRIPLWIKLLIGGVLVVLTLLLVSRWFVSSSGGRSVIEQQIESRVFSGQTVEIDRFEGDILSSFSIGRITLRDEDGVWGVIEDVRLNWSPWSLLSRHLKVKAFTTASIDIQRRPVLPETEDEPDSASGNPLKAITLKGFEIGQFTLHEGLTPQEVTGSVKGEAIWTPANARIDLDVRPGKTGGDLLALQAAWSPSQPINGTLQLSGPAKGLFATLLQLDKQSVTAQFKASGTATTVTGNGIVRLDDLPWINLAIRPEETGYEVTSSLDLNRHPLTAPHVARLGDFVTLTAGLDQSSGTKEPLKTVSVSTDVLSVTADDITLTGPEKSANVRAVLKQPSALIPEDQLSLGGISLEGLAVMQEDGYRFDGHVLTNDLQRSELAIRTLSGPLNVSFRNGKVTAGINLEAGEVTLKLQEPVTRLPYARLSGQFGYALETGAVSASEAKLETPKSRMTLTANAILKEPLQITGSGTGRIDLGELGLYDNGQIDTRWTVSQAQADSQSFTLTASANDLFAEGDPATDWLGKAPTVDLAGQFLAGKTIVLSKLDARTPALRLTGKGRATTEGRLAFSGAVTATDTYPLKDTLPGLNASVDLSGSADNLAILVSARAERAGPGEAGLDNLVLGFTGRWQDQTLTGKADLEGRYESNPVSLQTDITYGEGKWQFADILAGWQALKLTGDLSGDGGDLTAIEGDLRLAGDLPDLIPAETADITARIEGDTIRAGGRVDGIRTGPFGSGKLEFDVDGTFAELAYDIRLDGITDLGSYPQRTALTLSGGAMALDTASPSVNGTLNVLVGTHRFATTEPFAMTKTETGLQGQLHLAGFDGTIGLDLDEASGTPLKVALQNIRLAPVMTLLGNAPAMGTSDLSLIVSRVGGEMTADLSGQLMDLSLPQTKANPVSFHLNGTFAADGGRLILRTPEGQMLKTLADITAPVFTTASLPYLAYDGEKPGLIRLSLDGPIDNMSAILLPDTQSVRGVLKTDLDLPLPFDPQTLTGSVRFADGVFQHESLGTDLEGIQLSVDVKDGALVLSEFSASGRKGGNLNGAGRVRFAGAFESNLALTADRLVVVNRKEARAVASGTVGLDYTEKAIEIIGDLALNEGLFRLDSLPATSAPTLKVTFDKAEETSKTKAPLVSIDIAVSAPRSLKLVGRGMDAELSLDAKVEGTGSDIQLNGTARIVRGKFDLLGKRFEFEDSEIEFRGDPLQARLNIVASRDAEDFIARVVISGTPEQPEIRLSAEPELPEDEVLSRVLFGRSPSQLTGLEAARLAAALASLSGGGGFDLMGGIESLTGFDSVDVSQNQNGQFQVATGRYLADDIYMELSSDGTGAPGVSVEWEARKNISVEAETRPEKGQTLSVQWKRDFD